MEKTLKENGLGSNWSLVDNILHKQLGPELLEQVRQNAPQPEEVYIPQQMKPFHKQIGDRKYQQVKALYSLQLSPGDASMRSGLEVPLVQEMYKLADSLGCWNTSLSQLAQKTIIGMHIMDMIQYEHQEKSLTPTEATELSNYIEECNVLRKRVLRMSDTMLDKFETVLDTVTEARDVKNMAEALRTLNEVNTPISAKVKGEDTSTKSPSVHITLNNAAPTQTDPHKIINIGEEV